jgi:hypothetical protein
METTGTLCGQAVQTQKIKRVSVRQVNNGYILEPDNGGYFIYLTLSDALRAVEIMLS